MRWVDTFQLMIVRYLNIRLRCKNNCFKLLGFRSKGHNEADCPFGVRDLLIN